jgi:pimeloyl-ACP methyl ester carboxylesterase
MTCRLLLTALVCVFVTGHAFSETPAERREYRQKLLEILPIANKSPRFSDWVAATDALPPDFDSLPKINSLPDPLKFVNGRTVQNADDWKARRAEIIKYFQLYVIGSIPPKPKLDQIVPVDPEAARAGRGGGRIGGAGQAGGPGGARGAGDAGGATRGAGEAGGARDGVRSPQGAAPAAGRGGLPGGGRGGPAEGSITKIVDLRYGPESKITTRVTVVIPPGAGPFPVLIGGSPGITSRGYISCSSPGSVDSPPAIGSLYPGYDWASMAKVAWTAQMVVDYLYTLPEVDKRYIAITGYSRDGKMAVIAAMLDERITAVVGGSTGTGGVTPWRSSGERGAGEGIELATRWFPNWYAPQLRFFTGREDRLPVDGNLLAAAIAPRSILSLYGLNDEVGNCYANEQSYYSAQRIYNLLGVPDHNSILCLPGHHGANDQNAVMNWLDIQFGKSNAKWKNDFLFPWDYKKWSSDPKDAVNLASFPAHGENDLLASVHSIADWEAKVPEVKKSVEMLLGNKEGGNGAAVPPQQDRSITVDWVMGRPHSVGWNEPDKSLTENRSVTFGDGIRGELYYLKGTPAGAKLPTVIWLHGLSYPLGYMWVYRTDPDVHPILDLAKAGYAVLAFDQIGHGSRMGEFAGFFDRHPQWSHMGKMVADTRAAIDLLQREPMCDPDKIYLYGYSMGAMVGLHTAALDNRVKGVVSICGFTPMRTDTQSTGTGGLARYSVDLPLIPKLGAFIGNESRLPYDYNELIAAIAPRPVYVYAPLLDRDASPPDVRAAVEQAKAIYTLYNAADQLTRDEPWDYNRLPEVSQTRIIEWMRTHMR